MKSQTQKDKYCMNPGRSSTPNKETPRGKKLSREITKNLGEGGQGVSFYCVQGFCLGRSKTSRKRQW